MATYSKTEVVVLPNNMYQFLYSLSQQIANNPSVQSIPNYEQNVAAAYNSLNEAKTAGLYSDQTAAQMAINRFNAIQNNQVILFQ